jgi:hypothetical protein
MAGAAPAIVLRRTFSTAAATTSSWTSVSPTRSGPKISIPPRTSSPEPVPMEQKEVTGAPRRSSRSSLKAGIETCATQSPARSSTRGRKQCSPTRIASSPFTRWGRGSPR